MNNNTTHNQNSPDNDGHPAEGCHGCDLHEIDPALAAKLWEKPRLRLSGQDGNAFMLLGLAHRAAKKAGWSKEQWEKVRTEATSGDYDHLLTTLGDNFEVS